MQEQKTIPLHIAKEQEGSYFTLPVEVPAHVERLDIAYEYPRYEEVSHEGWTERREVCVVDLAVSAPGGAYVGSSGSDRSRIWICSAGSAQGYDSVPISPGTWEIIVGAYKIPAEGADVRYTVTFTRKELRLFRGDTHLHTLGSDGSMSVLDAARCAQFRGLDFIFLSDHNNFAQNFSRVSVPGVTVLPGTEWTHYKGHCGMLGVERPYRSAFCVNTREEAAAKLEEARANGAAVVLNHPFCPSCGWKWGFEGFSYDLVEVWNGATVEAATRDCVAWWHGQLCQGRRLPITGGSDYHRPDFGSHIGDPCTCLYALSREPEDLKQALLQGNGYVSYTPKGPGVSAQAAGCILGQTAPKGSPVHSEWFGLRGGDELRVITDQGGQTAVCPPGAARYWWDVKNTGFSFCRFEVHRRFAAGAPLTLAMISNPIYFA